MSTKPLKNPRHELFCQHVCEGMVATTAYQKAGFMAEESAARANASRLLANANIQARLQALRERSQKVHDVTVESLVAELDEARALAKQEGQAAAMTQAIMGKAKLLGLIIEKNHNVNENFENAVSVSDTAESPEEWLEQHSPPGHA